MPDTILIAELYGPVVQGEGALAGKVSHFIRTSGCGFRCSWCDSMHAVDPMQITEKSLRMTVDEILERIDGMPQAPWVTLTGGDPVAWDLERLCYELHQREYKIAVETQGSLWHNWLDCADLVTCSPKPPSSGMSGRLDMAMLNKYQSRLSRQHGLNFKIVVFDEVDLDFAEMIHREFPSVSLYISVGTSQKTTSKTALQLEVIASFREIAEAVLKRPELRDATVGCQIHTLLYGRELGR